MSEHTHDHNSDPNYIDLAHAAKRMPSHPHASTLWRWCRKGVKARDGSRVHLRHRRIGGKVWTTARWIDEFSDELTRRDCEHFAQADAQHAIAVAPDRHTRSRQPRSDCQRQRDIARAERELDAAGV